MNIIYKNSESLIKPTEIDVASCPSGVYIRRDIKKIEKINEQTNEVTEFYQYEEAFLTKNEYAQFQAELIKKTIDGDENSAALDNYHKKLDTAVEYPVNGFLYKPKWAEQIYAGLIQKGTLLPTLFPLKIWDATEKEENAAEFTIQELIALSVFLAQKQEQYFEEYKREKKQFI